MRANVLLLYFWRFYKIFRQSFDQINVNIHKDFSSEVYRSVNDIGSPAGRADAEGHNIIRPFFRWAYTNKIQIYRCNCNHIEIL